MTNGEIAERFGTIVSLLQMKGEKSFTVRAYQRAERTIERFPQDMDTMVAEGEDLTRIPGVGKAISDKITELVTTGNMSYLDRLTAEFPKAFSTLLRFPDSAQRRSFGYGRSSTSRPLRRWRLLWRTAVWHRCPAWARKAPRT